MRKILAFPFIILILLMFVSCPDGGGGGDNFTYEPADDFFHVYSSSPYLDIINNQIANVSARMEYSLDGGSSWTNCGGSLISVHLSQGNHVIARDQTDASVLKDLGTVEALSGRADLRADNKLYIGQGSWDDNLTTAPGDTFNIFTYSKNIGDTVAGTQNIKFYLSTDTDIDPAEDTLLLSHDYNYNIPADNLSYFVDCRGIDITVPDVAPGTYFVAAVMDAENNVSELNEENNTTSPEDMAAVYISSKEAVSDGAMKVVNSWGTGSTWQNVAGDGHYWMPYSTMKANRMAVYFYTNDFDKIYQPKLLACFKLNHSVRDEVKITIGLGNDLSSPVMLKMFESRDYSNYPIDGAYPFPDNTMVLDITEFASAINDYDLFMYINNTGGTSGTLESFSVEFYDDYPNSTLSTTTIVSNDTGAISSYSTKTAWISTKGAIPLSDLISITPPTRSLSSEATFVMEQPDDTEIAHDKEIIGIYEEGKNYNVLYQGRYGTGLQPPREEDWENMLKLRSIQNGLTRATFGGTTLPDEVDNSNTVYFPPIGDQGGKGSCAAFSMGYYIQTYTEAKEHGWDLSGVSWTGNDPTGLSESGCPDGSLDKIFSPDFIYHQINSGVENGAFSGYAAELAIRQGGATWENMPYRNKYSGMTTADYTSWPNEAAWRDAPLYRGSKSGNFYWTNNQSGYFIIEDDSDIQLLKSLLSLGYIVSTSIDSSMVYNSLDSHDVASTSIVWSGVDHAQTIVGYKEGAEWDSSNPDG